jgi:NAD+ kinase
MRSTLDARMTECAAQIEKDLPAWDQLTREKLDAVSELACSLSPTNSVEVKQSMRTALWELRQALEAGAAESLGAHPGSRPEVRKALEKVRTIALDNSFEGAARFPREVVGVRCGIDAIPNFREASPGIYRGGQPTQEGVDWLIARGVRTVVDLRGSDQHSPFCQWDPPSWKGVQHVNIQVEDYQTPSHEELARFITLADQASPDNPMFLHCKAGIGRTGTMIACWRITRGWTAEEAVQAERLHSYDASFRQEEFVRNFEQLWKSGQFAGKMAAVND